jgi:hypothetical protein
VAVRDFFGALVRHPLVVLVIAALTAIPLLRVEFAEPRYQARSVVTFLSPAAPFPRNAFASFTPALVTMAEVSSQWLRSSDARHAIRAAGGTGEYQVVLANRGNEELPIHDQPYLTVTTTAADPGQTRRTMQTVLKVMRDKLRGDQAAEGARPGSYISWQITEGSDRPVPVTGRPSRALIAIVLIGGLGAVYAAVTVDRRRRRSARPGRAGRAGRAGA